MASTEQPGARECCGNLSRETNSVGRLLHDQGSCLAKAPIIAFKSLQIGLINPKSVEQCAVFAMRASDINK